MIEITKNYLNFKIGEKYAEGPGIKAGAYEVMKDDRIVLVPKTHCKSDGLSMTGRVSTVVPPMPHSRFTAFEDEPSNDDPFMDLLLGNQVDKPKPKPEPVVVLSLKDNQVLMSHFTQGKLPKSGIDHVIEMHPSDTWNEEFWDYIPDLDSDYIWNPDCLEALILGNDLNEKTLLSGPPGTGKTTAFEQFAAIVGQPFFEINGKEGMEPSSFIGAVGPDGSGGWEWSDGIVPMCMKEDFALCINEVFKIPSGIQMTLQSVWQRGGSLVLDDKPGTMQEKLVKPGDKFRINGTDNCKGVGDNFAMYGSTQIQDTSTLDRFGITYELLYMGETEERALLLRLFPDLITESIVDLVKIASLIREAYMAEDVALTLSNRGLRAACRFMEKGLSLRDSLNLAYLNKLAEEAEIETVRKFIETVL